MIQVTTVVSVFQRATTREIEILNNKFITTIYIYKSFWRNQTWLLICVTSFDIGIILRDDTNRVYFQYCFFNVPVIIYIYQSSRGLARPLTLTAIAIDGDSGACAYRLGMTCCWVIENRATSMDIHYLVWRQYYTITITSFANIKLFLKNTNKNLAYKFDIEIFRIFGT